MSTLPPAQQTASSKRRWLNRYTMGLTGAAVLAAAGFLTWQHFWGRPSELDRYQFATVQRGNIEDLVTATGTLQPRDYVDVGAQVSGQLKKIHVEIGSVVQAGDLLAEIDPTVYLATVDARRAALRNLHATMAERQSQLALARLQQDRQRNLMAGDATTTESLQSAEASVRAAKAQVDALQAQIEQSESSLRADEANLNYAHIYSPISGVVVSISARQGQTLNTNQQAPTLLRVADLSTMTVQTQVSEADIGQLRPNMDAYFTTLGNRGRRWSGNLRKVEPTPTVTNNVVLYNALFDVANDQRNLLPQMTAQVFFVSASAKDVLTVPASAVTLQRQNADRRGGPRPAEKPAEHAASRTSSASAPKPTAKPPQPQVWAGVSAARTRPPREGTVKVVTADGKLEERKVQVGISNRVQVQILSGLREGEKVVAGLKPPPSANRSDAQRNALQGQSGMPPGIGSGPGPGPTGGPAGSTGARAR